LRVVVGQEGEVGRVDGEAEAGADAGEGEQHDVRHEAGQRGEDPGGEGTNRGEAGALDPVDEEADGQRDDEGENAGEGDEAADRAIRVEHCPLGRTAAPTAPAWASGRRSRTRRSGWGRRGGGGLRCGAAPRPAA